MFGKDFFQRIKYTKLPRPQAQVRFVKLALGEEDVSHIGNVPRPARKQL